MSEDLSGETFLRAVNLTKRFGSLTANSEISFEIARGEIHCLLGENGAGKSTFAECLYGYYQPDAGEIYIRGQKIRIQSPSDAIARGIGMVHQHFVLLRPMTILENIIVGTDAAAPILDFRMARERLNAICEEYGISVDLDSRVWQLSVGEQQWVEILKALFVGVDLLILDEPTAVLTPQEADKLFAILRKMRQEGISILFITHKLREVMAVSDRVTVFRKGELVSTVHTAEVNQMDLASMMVGREVLFQVNKEPREPGEPVLEVQDLRATNDRGLPALMGVSLQVRRGEIVGVAGVSGNGQRELFETIVGVREADSGRILLDNQEITRRSPAWIADAGISHIPEDRLKEGLIPDFSIAENLILGLHRNRFFWKGLYPDSEAVNEFARRCLEEFSIVATSQDQKTSNLSGGNLQRVILARELSTDPKVLIANQPTRGLDVGAIEYVHQRLIEERDTGVGVLLFSEDLDEILNLSDRIIVLFCGEIVQAIPASKAVREEIGLLMAGMGEESE